MGAGIAGTRRRLSRGLETAPGYGGLRTVGGMGALFIRSVRLAFTPPFDWWRASVEEASLAVRRSFIPLFVASTAFGVALIGIYGGQILELLGTSDRIGGPGYVAALREPSAWATMMITAGVAGSALTADLAARKIRDELSALAVLGVDEVRALIVPRVVGLALVSPVLGMISLAITIGELYIVAPWVMGVSREAFVNALALAVIPLDVFVFLVKFVIVGTIVGVVSAYKGLQAEGGAEGVGRMVNQTVVITFLVLWAFSVMFNSGYLSLFPELTTQRG